MHIKIEWDSDKDKEAIVALLKGDGETVSFSNIAPCPDILKSKEEFPEEVTQFIHCLETGKGSYRLRKMFARKTGTGEIPVLEGDLIEFSKYVKKALTLCGYLYKERWLRDNWGTSKDVAYFEIGSTALWLTCGEGFPSKVLAKIVNKTKASFTVWATDGEEVFRKYEFQDGVPLEEITEDTVLNLPELYKFEEQVKYQVTFGS